MSPERFLASRELPARGRGGRLSGAALAVALLLPGLRAGGEEAATRRQAVVGGSVNPGDPFVVAFLAPVAGCQAASVTCTGTLISERTILTAAHCIEGVAPGDLVYLGPDAREPGSGERIPVAGRVLHPDYSAGRNDVGLVLLAWAPGVRAAPLRRAPLEAGALGAVVRVAGYGVDGDGVGGLKRQGTSEVVEVREKTLVLAPAPAMSCTGDSGGPVFLPGGDGEELVAVTSYGDPSCTRSGTALRVDAYVTDFIAPTVAQLEALPAEEPVLDDACAPSGCGCITGSAAAGGGSGAGVLAALGLGLVLLRRRGRAPGAP